jgi:hypothetical protein
MCAAAAVAVVFVVLLDIVTRAKIQRVYAHEERNQYADNQYHFPTVITK